MALLDITTDRRAEGGDTVGMMPDREKVIDHLRILRTWCKVNSDYGMGLCVGECKDAVLWLDEALELLRGEGNESEG